MTIAVHDLEHWHPGASTPTLASVSFEVPKGALAVVIGPSGTGKTTLLRCLAGLDASWRGRIEIEDVRVVADRAPAPHRWQRMLPWKRNGAPERARLQAQLRGRVGLVFQTLELFPHLNVLENCLLAPVRSRRQSRREAEQRARSLLATLGLGDKAASYPLQLSGGERQRVAIARALTMEPRVLLSDEPTSALDPSLVHEVIDTLRRVRSTGVTQIIVTHDATLAREADLVFRLERGCIAVAPRP